VYLKGRPRAGDWVVPPEGSRPSTTLIALTDNACRSSRATTRSAILGCMIAVKGFQVVTTAVLAIFVAFNGDEPVESLRIVFLTRTVLN